MLNADPKAMNKFYNTNHHSVYFAIIATISQYWESAQSHLTFYFIYLFLFIYGLRNDVTIILII
jgi:hypothetical protein